MTAVVSRILAGVTSVALATSLGVLWVSPALADEADDPAALEVMGDYNADSYVDEAAALPEELVDAIDRDLGITPEEYLAESDAAVQAGTVVDSLAEAGVDVLGSSIEGTSLTVNVATDADVAVVESVGAVAVIGEPTAWTPPEVTPTAAEDIYGGQGIGWSNVLCSIGFNGYSNSGQPQLVTAGHCTADMGASEAVRALRMVKPGMLDTTGPVIGSPVAGTTAVGSGADVGRVAVTNTNISPKPSVLTWGNGTGAALSSTPQSVTRFSKITTTGANLCHSGARSGWHCGPIVEVEYSADVDDDFVVNSIIAAVCVLPGDSGGPALVGSSAVGITSFRYPRTGEDPENPKCGTDPNKPDFAGFFPMSAAGTSVQSTYGNTWELAVAVSTPVPSFSGTGKLSTSISGTLPGGSGPSTVAIYIDGSSTPFATVPASNGKWSASLTGISSGLHSYRVEGRYGTWSIGASKTGWFSRNVETARIAGADRYDTAAKVAAKFGTANVVYIASGRNYPDALSAAPAAASVNGPLLLTDPTSLPKVIATQLKALKPKRIVIVGGTSAVSTGVVSAIKKAVPGAKVVRVSGATRYETSQELTKDAFATSTVAYIATGTNFPDALAASAAAGKRNAPVILVDGGAKSIDAATKALLKKLGVTKIYISGGTAVVSQAIETQLKSIASVTRLAGDDRFQTGVAVNLDAFSTAPGAYLALGYGYADALAGAALAGSTDAPLFVTPGDCVPTKVLDALRRLDVTNVTLLGGTAVLNKDVEALKSC